MRRFCEKFKVMQYLKLIFMIMAFLFITAEKQASAAEKLQASYQIKVNRVHNTITIYEKDEAGKYTLPVKAMVCSVGLNGATTTGTFQTKEKYRWKALMGDVWGQYSTRIVGGILFHSVYYYEYGNPATLATKQFNKLGTAASHGCIRLSVADAKWIYDNCNAGTTVIIYDDKNIPGPLGKPETIKIPSKVRWDPTDPSPQNPYYDVKPKISGTKDFEVEYGETVDLLKGISAESSLGTNITSQIKLQGEVDSNVPGKYKIIYSVTDILGRIDQKTVTVTVAGSKEPPILTGVADRIAGGGTKINREYALAGVEAYCNDQKLDKKLISVDIEEAGKEEYHITYSVTQYDFICTESAVIHIDREAPVLLGVTERDIEDERIPDKKMALEGVTAMDNYTKINVNHIQVTITKAPDESYFVVYEVKDEAGNSAAAQTIFH